MSPVSAEQLERAKSFIFQHGRLLERKLFEFFFEEGSRDACVRARLATMVDGLPTLLAAHADHYPLLGRYWFYAADLVDRGVLEEQAERFVDGLQQDGGVATPYPDLPWWRPIFTLDGLILLKRYGLL